MEAWVKKMVFQSSVYSILIRGIIFMQPDMLESSRIREPDFELKVGYAVILLEFRIQQSPKTHLYSLRSPVY